VSKMLNVGVDIDGVLSNFVKAARILLKTMFNGRPKDSLIQTTWAFSSLGITTEEENQMWRKIDSIPNWWLGHEVLPNTDLLYSLCNKHRVIFITNRKDGTGRPVDKQSAMWLTEKFHLFHPIVLLSNKKGPLAKALKLDYYIDDRPKNVLEVVEFHPSCKTFLLDATYNQECIYTNRVKSFDEFAKRLL